MSSQNFASRLQRLIEDRLRMKPSRFAEAVGISRSYLSELLSGKKATPGPDILQRISSEFNVRYEWLLRGEGDVFAKSSEQVTMPPMAVHEEGEVLYRIREGPSAAARRMADVELLAEIDHQYRESLRAKPYMKPAHKEILQAFFDELLSRIDRSAPPPEEP